MTERMQRREPGRELGALVAERAPDSGRGLLRQSLLDTTTLAAAAPPAGAAFVVDQHLRYLVAAGDALHVAGFCPEDFIGKSLLETLEPELAARYELQYRKVLEGGSFAEEHESHGRAYLSRGIPLRDPEGRVNAALVVSYDITERKRAALLETRSEEILSGLIEQAPFGVVILDASFRVRAVNPASEALFGDVLLGRDLGEVLRLIQREPLAKDVAERFRHTLATGEPHVAHTLIEGRIRAGAVEAYDWSIRRLVLPDGSFGVVCYFCDLTPIRDAELVLAAAARRHAFLVAFSDAIAPLTTARDVTRVAAEKLGTYLAAGQVAYAAIDDHGALGVIEDEWNDGTLPSDAAPHRLDHGEAVVDALGRGETVVIPDILNDARTSAPSVRDTLGARSIRALIGVPLVQNDRLVAVMAVHHATERAWTTEEIDLAREAAARTWSAIERARAEAALRQSEERLREVDRRKDEFLAILAHELRNPLAPIRTGLEILRLRGATPDTVAQVRPVMERQLAHLVRLVDDLLDVSRITSGKIQLQRQRTTLRALVASAVEAHHLALQSTHRDLVVDLPESPVVLDVDPTRVTQVVSNLLHNAIKFTKPGDLIRIAGWMEPAGPSLLLTVTDTGAGISKESLPGIFELFAQGDSPDAPRGGGLGIGLALARRLIELHGGTITAASDGPGHGSAFTVRLPVLRDVVEPAVSPPSSEGVVRRRVLVVDDNTDAADTMAMLIAALGGQSAVAYDGESALEHAAAFEPDAILLDIGMPGMDGYDTCRHLRARLGAAVHIIALTGLGQQRDKDRALVAGFDAHLTKPVEPGTLKKLLTEQR